MFESWPEMWGGGYPAYRTTLRKFLWFRTVTGGNAPEFKTVTGRIVSFLTKRIAPLKIEADLEPIQDLHGQDAPYPPGGGDNLLPPLSTETKNYVTLTNDNGQYTLSGTASANTFFTVDLATPLDAGVYTWQLFNPSAISGITCYLLLETGNTSLTCSNANQVSAGFSVSNKINSFRIRVDSGTALSNFKLSPTLTKGSNELPAFKPYSNICPITGHTGAVVNVNDGNWFDETNAKTNKYLESDGAEHNSTGWKLSDYIPVKPNTQYTFQPNSSSGGVAKSWFYDANKNGISYIASGEQTFTTPSNCAFMRFSYRDTSTEIMLNLGSSALPYVAHDGSSVTLTFGSTVYGGKLTVNEDGSGTVVGDVKEKVFSAFDLWTTITGFSFGRLYILDVKSSGGVNATDYITSILPTNIDVAVYSTRRNDTTFYFYFPESTTREEAETLLSGMQIIYPLATPITLTLSPGQVNALKGNNTVWVDDSDNISVTYQSN